MCFGQKVRGGGQREGETVCEDNSPWAGQVPGKDIFTLSVSSFVTTPFPVEGWSGRDEGERKSEFNIFTDDFRLKSKQHLCSSIRIN